MTPNNVGEFLMTEFLEYQMAYNSSYNSISTMTVAPSGVLYMSDEVLEIFVMINWVVIITSLCFFGIAVNIINLIVIVKQGFLETVNVTLFAMAISDLGTFVTLLWMSMGLNPLFRNADIPYLSVEIVNVSGGWPHIMFVKITGWLTAFLTFERCLCVIFPLKVKVLLTPSRVKVIVFGIYLFVIATVIPSMATTKLAWKFVPHYNRTMFGMVSTEMSSKVVGFVYAFNGVISSFAILAVILLFTIILIYALKSKSKWRAMSAANTDKSQTIKRERKLIKMLVIIAIICILCLLPFAIISVPQMTDPDFNIGGAYQNFFYVICSFSLILEGVNASVNIFIYYKMNSKYRVTFRQIFKLKDKDIE